MVSRSDVTNGDHGVCNCAQEYTVYMHRNTGIILGAWAKVFKLDVAAVFHQKLKAQLNPGVGTS